MRRLVWIALVAAACTNDYDDFSFVADAGSAAAGGSASGGSAGSVTCIEGCAPGLVCDNGRCVCDGDTACGDTMASCRSDGRCRCRGDSCRPGETCVQDGPDVDCACNGGPACGGGETCCAGGCVDLDDDGHNCGGCGRACAAGQQCNDGECRD